MTDKFELSRRKALLGLTTIGAAGAAAGYGTSALFSDTEEFQGNTIQAGTTNLVVEASVVSVDTSNRAASLEENGLYVDIQDNTSDGDTADGDPAMGLTVSDMKPGDSFIIRTTVDVQNNPMYVAVSAENTADSENTNPEPEPTPGADEDDDALPGGGDLDNKIDVTYGYDDDRNSLHDNNIEGSLTSEFSGSATEFISNLQSGILYRGRNGAGGSPPGGHGGLGDQATRIGGNAGNVDREKVTHFAEFALPVGVGNQVMGDSFSFDLVWSAEQVRNNADPANATEVDGAPN